jgi:hypothetical protein
MVEASDQQIAAHPGLSPADSPGVTRDQTRAVFGQVMGFVALTLGFLTLGAYIGRDLSRDLQLFGGNNEQRRSS